MNDAVLSSLIPIIFFIAIGVLAGRMGWVRQSAVKDLTQLVFMVLTPALLFRSMLHVEVNQLDFGPVGLYFVSALLLFGAVLLLQRFTALGAARALGAVFSNNVMIGIPLVRWVYGDAGLVVLLTLISIHALVLLTLATVVFELAKARDVLHIQSGGQAARSVKSMLISVGRALQHSLLHPVPVPIMAGLLAGALGWQIPEVLDRSLLTLGQAMGPVALLLVGLTLAYAQIGRSLRAAACLALLKNLALPVLFLGVASLCGLSGLPLAVLLTASCLPIGANVYLFSMTYEVAQDEVTSAIALSNLIGLVTVPLVIWWASRLLSP